MFDLFYGNDLDGLAVVLAQRIARASRASLLIPEIVLVPQAGMQRWLEISLAERDGIVANVDFRLPGEFIRDQLRADSGRRTRAYAFDRDVLRWRLMPLLARIADEAVGAPIAHYLGSPRSQLKRLQLARELSAAFERYQAYRRDLLDRWEAGGEPHEWQAELWRRLVRGSDEPHRARLIGDFLTRYDSPAEAPPGLPARLSIFGCLNISPDVLRCFGVVARSIDVDFYLPTPCREYWGDVIDLRTRLRRGEASPEPSEQPLLASFGRVGREFLEQVFSYEEVQPAGETEVVREPDRATLLGRIQADILELRRPGAVAPRPAFDDNDHSLRVHDCHSPLREVEVLHDHLLAMFARDATLKPRDIVVMTPDVAVYAAAIDAVFGALPPSDPRRIPYTIADRSTADTHPLVAMFIDWLGLAASRWTLAEMLDVLAVPAIMRKAGIDDDALARLRVWLYAAGIRWGLDADTRAQFAAGDYAAFTWAEGIERLLLGFASGDAVAIGDMSPLPLIEGHAATMFGQALSVLRELERLATAQRIARNAREWQALYQSSLRALLPDRGLERDERRAIDAIDAALAAFAEAATAGECDEALDWQTVRAVIVEQLTDHGGAQLFLRGGVSFCGMVPLRAIPFRVIAVIGLGDEAFPRREPASGISRIEAELRTARRLGDRSVRDDDRYLFLQLLTSTRDALHLSYVGRDARTGKSRAPSAVVAELIDEVVRDYIGGDAEFARHRIVVQHPLQPFAQAQFDASSADVFTYRDAWHAAAGGTRNTEIAAFAPATLESLTPAAEHDVGMTEHISFDRLRRFWRNPARMFLSGRLHLDHVDTDVVIDDADPLELDALQQYGLRQNLIVAHLGGEPARFHIDEASRMRLALPVGAVGAEIYSDTTAIASAIAIAVAQQRGSMTARAPMTFAIAADIPEVDCAQADAIVEGTIADLHEEGLVRWTAGKLHGGGWLFPWLDYVAFVAAQDDRGEAKSEISLALVAHEQAIKVTLIRGLERERARSIIATLVQRMREGSDRPLAFFPKSAWEYVAVFCGRDRDSSAENACDMARKIFDGGDHATGECNDASIALAFRDRHPFDDAALLAQFQDIALAVFGELGSMLHGGSR